MRLVRNHIVRCTVVLSIAALWLSSGSFTGSAGPADTSQNALVRIKAFTGKVEYSIAGGPWQDAKTNIALGRGTIIRSQDNSTADLYLPYSHTTLRLISNSIVKVERLERHSSEVETLTETRLILTQGSLVGSQRKLPRASSFAIVTSQGEAVIRGTEYVVRSDGAVTVLSGAVSVRYNRPGGGGSVLVMVQQGQSFDPVTGTVVPTTAAYLQNLIAHINTVRNNAETFRLDNGGTVVVRPEPFVSPTTPFVGPIAPN